MLYRILEYAAVGAIMTLCIIGAIWLAVNVSARITGN